MEEMKLTRDYTIHSAVIFGPSTRVVLYSDISYKKDTCLTLVQLFNQKSYMHNLEQISFLQLYYCIMVLPCKKKKKPPWVVEFRCYLV